MKISKISTKNVIAAAALAMELNSCASSNIIKFHSEEVGKNICKVIGDKTGTAQDSKDQYQHSLSEKDLPKTIKLEESELENYIKDKKIVLAGEMHDRAEDGEIFMRLIPALKKAGFEYLGIEIDETRQGMIDKYYQSGDEEESHAYLASFQPETEELWKVVKTAKMHGLKVICFDYRPHKGHKQFPKDEWWQKWWTFREEQMFLNIEKVLQKPDDKIVIFVGRAHATSASEDDDMYGFDKEGLPRIIHTDKPLGYRLVEKYGKANVGMIDFSGCSTTSPYTYTCVDEK